MEQVETKVDVLAVMADYSAQHGNPEDFEQARAAVAELIEASTQLVALDDCEAPCDPACVYCRMRAALARVGGGK